MTKKLNKGNKEVRKPFSVFVYFVLPPPSTSLHLYLSPSLFTSPTLSYFLSQSCFLSIFFSQENKQKFSRLTVYKNGKDFYNSFSFFKSKSISLSHQFREATSFTLSTSFVFQPLRLVTSSPSYQPYLSTTLTDNKIPHENK